MASYSSLTCTQRCQRSRILRSALKGCQPTSEALVFGTAYHESIETGTATTGIVHLQKHGMEDQIPLLEEMLTRYQVFMAKNGVNILEHEVDFSIPMEDGDFVGKIDGIAEWNGDIYLVEFKTAKYLTLDHIDMDAQITAYLWACDKLGIYNPKGMLWIGNKKAFEREPVVLKNGHLSVAKNNRPSYSAYKRKAEEIYGDEIPENVVSYMNWLKVNDNPSIAMVRTTRTEKQKNDCEKSIVKLMKEEKEIMDNFKTNGIVQAMRDCTMLPSKMCMQMCFYKDLCRSMYSADDITDEDVAVYIDGLKEVV